MRYGRATRTIAMKVRCDLPSGRSEVRMRLFGRRLVNHRLTSVEAQFELFATNGVKLIFLNWLDGKAVEAGRKATVSVII